LTRGIHVRDRDAAWDSHTLLLNNHVSVRLLLFSHQVLAHLVPGGEHHASITTESNANRTAAAVTGLGFRASPPIPSVLNPSISNPVTAKGRVAPDDHFQTAADHVKEYARGECARHFRLCYKFAADIAPHRVLVFVLTRLTWLGHGCSPRLPSPASI
jgi:hypothetical protein